MFVFFEVFKNDFLQAQSTPVVKAETTPHCGIFEKTGWSLLYAFITLRSAGCVQFLQMCFA